MKHKLIKSLSAFLTCTSLFFVTPIVASATTDGDTNVKETLVENNISKNINLSDNDNKELMDNRDLIKENLSTLGLSDDLIDSLIDKQLRGEILDAYKPEMEKYSVISKENGYIVKTYPDGSIKANTDLEEQNKITRGTIKQVEVISSSSFHRTIRSNVQCFVGLFWFNYDVTWTDYRDQKSIIEDADFVGSLGCTFNSIKINSSKDTVICIVDVSDGGSARDKCTIKYGALESHN